MKAIVKATGEIVTVRGIYTPTIRTFGMEEIESYDIESVEIVTDPDYWTRLEHQYVGMAMQGLMSKEYLDNPDSLVSHAIHYAHALVEKMKEERK